MRPQAETGKESGGRETKCKAWLRYENEESRLQVELGYGREMALSYIF